MSTFGMVLTDSAGNQYFVEANPGFVSLTGSNAITANVETIVTTGTAVQLPSISCKEVTLIGLKANGATVYVGGSNVTTSIFGAALDQKDSITLSVSNANLIWINGNAGDGVSYVAL